MADFVVEARTDFSNDVSKPPVLEVRDLVVRFERADGVVHAVNGVDFAVRPGEWIGIIGESGSGKSVTLMSILGLLGEGGRVIRGNAWFNGVDLVQLSDRQLRTVRGKDIGVVFQNLAEGFNPYLPIGSQIAEVLVNHRLCTRRTAHRRVIEFMHELGIADAKARFQQYPHELSGGMRQRAMIASAIVSEPKVIFADEPTTALDSTVQMQVLALLTDICRKRGTAVVMVTHDLGVAAHTCDRIVVMYGGIVMEEAPIDEFLQFPTHPYTLGLRAASFDPEQPDRPLRPIPGVAPVLLEAPRGCPFAPRCHMATTICRERLPALRQTRPEHRVACHHVQGENEHEPYPIP
ncbi:oligopeptide/dipeptide ABC transporter, ATPase subunit [Alicyclobacillus hesperidum URH17-3-68]|uniref:ABC transporter ATP-binding protein n=1 Tax=Alicyclobacillus hesperidum TaxID=89784 RepID=UPI000281C26E|nr:ABC transporter ATP-binding protein [Alicyclobacillus hesperidum]EJY55107.1 oligopeptide/dipeptide ABC transporter, ATPase subunit [Alicyclobacillus hesperidum URH17-3-68]